MVLNLKTIPERGIKMSNPTGNKLEKLVFGMFDQMVEGADKYVTKQGSTWLIFTEDKRWVIEFTKDKTLWFNYNLFQSEFELISKDCTEERDLIKKWFELRFLNKPKVQDTIQNGVKHTHDVRILFNQEVEDTIQNGVKETKEMEHDRNSYHGHFILEDDIPTHIPMDQVQDVIENGVKDTKPMDEWVNSENIVSEVIDVGVNVGVNVGVKKIGHKKTSYESFTNHIIEEGVKDIKEVSNFNLMSEIFKVNAKKAIIDGVKELKELPDKSGEFRGYGDWYQRQGNMAKPHTEYVKEVIEDSYNHMGRVEGVIRNTDKDGI